MSKSSLGASVESLVFLLLIAGVFALPFLKQRWSLVLSYFVGITLAGYGIATIVPNVLDSNHLSGLAYIVGAIVILIGGGMVVLARYLYRAKNSNK